jgi:hypothetical protein
MSESEKAGQVRLSRRKRTWAFCLGLCINLGYFIFIVTHKHHLGVVGRHPAGMAILVVLFCAVGSDLLAEQLFMPTWKRFLASTNYAISQGISVEKMRTYAFSSFRESNADT